MTTDGPQGKAALADLITRCIDGNDLRGALAACQRLNSAHPDFAYGWYLASFAMKRARHYTDALRAIDLALRLDAADKYRLHRARVLLESNDLAGATAAAQSLVGATSPDARLHNELASLLHVLGDHPAALRHYARAVELEPGNAEFQFNAAALKRYLGDAAGAEAGFDAVIATKPDEWEAYNARAHLRRQTREHNHIADLQAAIGRTQSPAGLTQLYYALAKEQEDVGDFAAAFASLSQGAATKRRHMQYSLDTDLAILARIRAVYGAAMFDGHVRGCSEPGPIFILGMPRTGTTLVERILGSHSAVFAAGELNNFSLELVRLARQVVSPAPATRLDFVDATARLDFAALGQAYLDATRPLRDASPYFIDKLPFNYLYAGLIHLALPRARIINLQRHPLDTCFAVYKQLFKDAYPFSYDLDELGRYYVAYVELMQHWNRVMPGVIHTLQYESLVADLEGESRRLLDYCGLPWEEQCLRFHENTRATTTASALQVRQPLYATSVGKWRQFAAQLAGLRRTLEHAGIDTGPA